MKGLEGTKFGRYELWERIAHGGLSEVFLGYDHHVRRQVAIKVLYSSNKPFIHRFEHEALAIGALSHDHILPLYDFGAQHPWYYLVMPFVEGETLRDYLYTHKRLTLDEAGSILEQITSALQYAHNHGVIHRDVKPANILLRPDGHAYLVDFGLAKATGDADVYLYSSTGIGTPEYMAPEQADGSDDPRSDIYSLGIILYQMLTGDVPFTADSPMGVIVKHLQLPPPRPGLINEELPQEIEDIILKALAKKPEERYQEAKDFSNAYKQVLLARRTRTQALPSLTPVIIKHALQERPEEYQAVSSPHISRALSGYPLDVSPTRPPVTLSHKLSPEYQAFSLAIQQQAKRRKRRARLLTLTLCLLIVTLTLTLTFNLLWQIAPVALQKMHAGLSSTQIAQQQATAMTQAQTQATLAAQAHVQAIEDITPSLNAGRILYYNEMIRPVREWINDGNQCTFSPQGYTVSTYTPRAVAWCYNNQQRFSNAIITAQANLLRGDFCGIVFRLNPGSTAFYVLELNSTGKYRFQRALGRDPSRWLTLIDWTSSSAIHPGYGQSNSFLIVANGTDFRFYINRQLILSTFSDRAYAAGFIGLLVGGDNKKGTQATFSRMVVLQKRS